MSIEHRKATQPDYPALEQMLELYQYDLSDIWPQDTDASARFGFDLTRHRRDAGSHAYVTLFDGQYAGFALVAPAIVTRTEGKWMEQFCILRRFRRHGTGRALARYVLHTHPGPWEIGQMPANLPAQAFWRAVIGEVTSGCFQEITVTEGWWKGLVQQFEVPETTGRPNANPQ